MKPYWSCPQGDIYCADAADVLGELDAGSFSVCVTSPPYNMRVAFLDAVRGEQATTGDDRDLLKIQLRHVLWALGDVMEPEASIFWNFASPCDDPLLAFEVVADAAPVWRVQNAIHWIKSVSIDGRGSFGHIQPINSGRFLSQAHEYLWHLTRDGAVSINRKAIGVPYEDPANAQRWAAGADGLRCRGNVWHVPYETRQGEAEHPAAFPDRLVEMCLRLHGLDRIERVLDPFAGSGTTLRVAAGLGLRYTGIDIDEGCCRLMTERFAQQSLFAEVPV